MDIDNIPSWEDQKFAAAASPDAWLDVATELKEAADVLWKHHPTGMSITASWNEEDNRPRQFQKPKHSRPWFLLVCFAIENLLKGVLVLRDSDLVADGKLKAEVKSHDLSDLAIRTGLPFDAEELRLIELADQAVVYWSRYPIPLKAHQIADEVASDERLKKAFDRIFVRVDNEITSGMFAGWTMPNGGEMKTHVRQAADENGAMQDWEPSPLPY